MADGTDDILIDLLDYDLTRRTVRTVPTGQMGIADSVEPLVRFCRRARRAPDITAPNVLVSPDGAELKRGLGRDLKVAYEYLRAGGLSLVADRAATRIRRLRD